MKTKTLVVNKVKNWDNPSQMINSLNQYLQIEKQSQQFCKKYSINRAPFELLCCIVINWTKYYKGLNVCEATRLINLPGEVLKPTDITNTQNKLFRLYSSGWLERTEPTGMSRYCYIPSAMCLDRMQEIILMD